jgi:hypothetical protein
VAPRAAAAATTDERLAVGMAAERLGLPHATVLITASGSFVRPDAVALLEQLRRA